jgi:hypothetical protein
MAGYYLHSFHWETFKASHAPPATELAKLVAQSLPKKHSGVLALLPNEPEKLVQVQAKHFVAEDWYSGKSVAEAQLAERLLDAVFNDKTLRQELACTEPASCSRKPTRLALGSKLLPVAIL